MKAAGRKVMESDESKFVKRKYHCVHYVKSQWVFGSQERSSGHSYLLLVKDWQIL
jgi:hypothetical protein